MNKKIIICLLIGLSACADLDTENLNQGDIARVLSNPDDYIGLVEAQFRALWHATQFYPALTLATAADSYTSSQPRYGMRDMSNEPREALNNSPTYSYASTIEQVHTSCYRIIGTVNDVLRIMKSDPGLIVMQNGVDVTLKTKSQALYLQGISYGLLALYYDKAKFVDENIELENAGKVDFISYKEMMVKALEKLEIAIDAAKDSQGFDVTAYNGIILTRDEFIRLIRTMQAKFMVYNSRNDTENAANDWGRVLSLVNQGITNDFAPLGDGATWFDLSKFIGNRESIARVDYRIIHAMDPTQPSRFPTDNSHPLPPASGDKRLETDMMYLEEIPFRAEHGLYHYSHYDFIRYTYHEEAATGPMPHTTVVENDLITAEALVRTDGSKITAAQLINKTRVGRGELIPVTENDTREDLLNAIMHERYIELYATMGGIPFYDRRRSPDDDGSFSPYSGLQPNTFRHFPIPGKELTIIGEPIYTFGG